MTPPCKGNLFSLELLAELRKDLHTSASVHVNLATMRMWEVSHSRNKEASRADVIARCDGVCWMYTSTVSWLHHM